MCPADHGEYRSGTHPFITGRLPTTTGNHPLLLVRRLPPQQFCDCVSSGLMDGGANRHLHGFQVQLATLVALVEDPLELLL